MQFGMIGLGRHGRRHGAPAAAGRTRCVVYDLRAAAVAALVAEGATGSASLAEFVAALALPRHLCLMVPAALRRRDASTPRAAPRRRRHDRRRRQLAFPGRHRARHATPPRRPALRRHGDLRRRLGSRARLLPDDRRRGGDRASARSDVSRARPGPRRDPGNVRGARRARDTAAKRATCTAVRAAPATSSR